MNNSHVIMVDDDEADVQLAKTGFATSGLANPWKSFPNGLTFLAYLDLVKKQRAPMPSLVLLDLQMPAMSGFEVLERTRKDPFFVDLPIFCVLSNSSDPRDQARAVSLGASGFVTKPDTVEGYSRFFSSLA